MRTQIYFATFFFTLHYAFLIYVNSSFLAQFFTTEEISGIYTLGAVFTMFALAWTPHLVNTYRRFTLTSSLLIILAGTALALGVAEQRLLVLAIFLAATVATVVLRFLFDIYLEQYSKDSETGNIRGVMLTVTNTAFVCSPYLVGKLIDTYSISAVYFVAALLLIPALGIVLLRFGSIPHRTSRESSSIASFARIWKSHDLRNAFMGNFFLEFFYAWMVIYMPLYLSEIIGFSWEEIGIIFSIMLLPFVLFQLPLGRIADRITGEGDIMAFGFFVMSFFTGTLAFFGYPHLAAWAVLLFMTRVGAAAVEIMTESYFFKHVSVQEGNLIGAFRDARPIAFIIAPLVGNLLMASYGYQGIFVTLAALMLFAMQYGLNLKPSLSV